tara:strand:+ start:81 stop:368 length:288 start_codon:yes stop_codon:yes gene_type:complete
MVKSENNIQYLIIYCDLTGPRFISIPNRNIQVVIIMNVSLIRFSVSPNLEISASPLYRLVAQKVKHQPICNVIKIENIEEFDRTFGISNKTLIIT